jgi:RNA polymerase sigma factor (sigma-70 family)
MTVTRENVQSFLPTRRSLLSRIRDWDDQESWRRFFDTYWRLIYNTAVKAGLSDAEAQDVVQETILTVAKKIKEFHYDPTVASFKGWLLTITRWRIADQFRKSQKQIKATRSRRDVDTSSTATIDRLADPAVDLDAVWEEEWEQTVFAAALQHVKRQANARHYQIFDLYALQNWPAEKVAQTLGVTSGQVRLAKHRVMALIRREVARLEKQSLRGPLSHDDR